MRLWAVGMRARNRRLSVAKANSELGHFFSRGGHRNQLRWLRHQQVPRTLWLRRPVLFSRPSIVARVYAG